MVRAVWLDNGADTPGRLLLAAHHLVVDGVSWRILLPDLAAAVEGRELEPVGTSLRGWAEHLTALAGHPSRMDELALWKRQFEGPDPVGGRAGAGPRPGHRRHRPPPSADVAAGADGASADAGARRVPRRCERRPARRPWAWRWPTAAPQGPGGGHRCAGGPGGSTAGRTSWRAPTCPVRSAGSPACHPVRLEPGVARPGTRSAERRAAGRTGPEAGQGAASRAAGQRHRLRSAAPPQPRHRKRAGRPADPADRLQLPRPPRDRHPRPRDWAVGERVRPAGDEDMPLPRPSTSTRSPPTTPDGARAARHLELAGRRCSPRRGTRAGRGAGSRALTGLAPHAEAPGAGGRTPSDLPLVDARQDGDRHAGGPAPSLADVRAALAPMQEGLLFHAAVRRRCADVYPCRWCSHLAGALDDPGAARRRAGPAGPPSQPPRRAFRHERLGDAPSRSCTARWRCRGRHRPAAARRGRAGGRDSRGWLAEEPVRRLRPGARPRCCDSPWCGSPRTAAGCSSPHHHILFDGWSMPVLLQELFALYAPAATRRACPPPPSYRDVPGVAAPGRTMRRRLEAAWRQALAGSRSRRCSPRGHRRRPGHAPGAVPPDVSPELTTALTDLPRARADHEHPGPGRLGAAAQPAHRAEDVVFGATVSGRPAERAESSRWSACSSTRCPCA